MGYSDAYPGGYGVGGDLITTLLIETDPDDWYDATDALISGDIIRGRSSELDEFQAGTCQVVLDNDDRTFDPTYTSSPLNGYILPMKRVRLLATWAGVQYPLFAGYADRWTQNREGPHRGTTTLAATDGFKVLSRARLASSAYAQEVSADGPVHWWRLDELDGTTAYDAVGDLDLAASVTPAPIPGADTLLSRDPGAAAEFDDAEAGYSHEGALPITAGPLTIEAVFRSTPGAQAGVIAAFFTYVGGTGAVLYADPTYGFSVAKTPGGAVATQINGSTPLEDEQIHHIVGVWNADGTLKVYIDGADRTVGTPSLAVGSLNATSGTVQINGLDSTDAGILGQVDEVALYDYALSPARITAHYQQVATPWNNDLPGDRIERVLDAIGWTADRDVDTGSTVLQSAEIDVTALEHIQGVAATEFGAAYMTADGTFRFEDREASVNQAPVADFSDAAGSDLPITASSPELSDEHIRNDVTISRLEGSAQNARDQASIDTYQISSYVRDGLYHDDDAHSRYAAQYILEAYKDPVERVSAMTVNPYRDPDTLWPAILALELTDRITLTETPQHVAPAVARTLVVEGIQHTFAAKQWEASFNVSESRAATQAYWALGVAGSSELGETTRLYF